MSEIASMRIRDIQFEVTIKNKRPKRPIGQAVVNFSLTYEKMPERSLETRIPIDTLWINRDKKDAIKSHLRVSTGNAMHRLLYATIHKFGMVKSNVFGQFLTADRRGLIRYGPKSGVLYSDQDGDWNTFYVYDSYVQAVKLCLATVEQHKQIGGLESVSFKSINPEVLIEFGFEEIKDVFRVGPSMWKGNADTFLKMQDGYVPSKELAKNAAAFLEYIRRSFNEAK